MTDQSFTPSWIKIDDDKFHDLLEYLCKKARSDGHDPFYSAAQELLKGRVSSLMPELACGMEGSEEEQLFRKNSRRNSFTSRSGCCAVAASRPRASLGKIWSMLTRKFSRTRLFSMRRRSRGRSPRSPGLTGKVFFVSTRKRSVSYQWIGKVTRCVILS